MLDFYSQLLGLRVEVSLEDDYVYLEGGPVTITLQVTSDYQAPTWPGNERGIQIHLDLSVADLQPAVEYALSIVATNSPVQYSKHWHILLDPAGHPFCLVQA